ncbi:MAG: lipopolysaccharide heptosyltransferase II [Rhizobiaceae bacterium]
MTNPEAILVIGPRWVGDMVMAQCLFSALKEKYPDAAIDVMAPAWAGPLVGRMPEVRERLDAPFGRGRLEIGSRWRAARRLRGRYAQAYVMQGNWKSALIPLFAGIRKRVGYLKEFRYGLLTDIVPLPREIKRRTARTFFGLARGGTYRDPHLSVDAANQENLFATYGLTRGNYAVLMPGAEYGPAKRWPPERYAALAGALIKRGMRVVLLGSANDRPVTREIVALAPGTLDLAGETRLEDAIDLTAGAVFAVSNDSGLMHIAAAVDTPVIAIFGSTSPDNTPPLTEARELVTLRLACSPCHARVCPLGHMNCLNHISVEQVLVAADRLTAGRQPA